MWKRNVTAVGCLLAALALSGPSWGATTGQSAGAAVASSRASGAASAASSRASAATTRPGTAYPGTLNYVDGQAAIGDEVLNSQSIGSAQIAAGQTLATGHGKAEVLLTPGVFLRVGDNGAIKMVSPDLTNTDVQLQRGEATVEVTEIYPENRIIIEENGASTRLLKTGFYDFDANQDQVRVFEGEALVQTPQSEKEIKVKGGHELDLNATNLKSHGFDKKAYDGSDLYNWSSLRSAYVAEANADLAPTYVLGGWYGAGWFGAGWYWDPWFSAYTFLPSDGIFYSPFGWGFYSPFFAYNYFGGFGHYGPRYFHRFGMNPAGWGPALRNTPTLRAGGVRGLQHSSPLTSNPRGFSSLHGTSGFRSGADGGFHGGELGSFHGGEVGGFHGGGFAGGARGPGR